MSLRNERVRKTLMKEIADIIQKDIRDPRITGVVSITDIELAHDNSFAKVFFSVFAIDDESKKKTINFSKRTVNSYGYSNQKAFFGKTEGRGYDERKYFPPSKPQVQISPRAMWVPARA